MFNKSSFNFLSETRDDNDSDIRELEFVTVDQEHYDVLRKVAERVNFPLSEQNRILISKMKELIGSLGNAAGIAAPQVGYSLQIILIQVPPKALELRKNAYEIVPLTVLINPVYTGLEIDGKSLDWESCFSIPNKMGEVERYNTIDYEAFNELGDKVSGRAQGFLARLIQHETDHVYGRLYIDLLNEKCRFGETSEMAKIRQEENSLKIVNSL